MSRRTRSAAVVEPPGLVVDFALDTWPWPPRFAEAILFTLAAGHDVWFTFTSEDTKAWFRLRGYRGAIHVLGPSFDHLATTASVEAAMTRGWELGGPMGQAVAAGAARLDLR